MIDVQKINTTKEKIVSTINASGPSFPTKISRETGISPLFTGALLSEMVSEKKLVMSHMKVGSSPLYFLPNQEPLLENFTQYLNSKEKEALARLKNARILDDTAEDPAIRVALRKLKDFAVPITVRKDETEKLFWKFFTVSDIDAEQRIEEIVSPEKAQKKYERKEELPKKEITKEAEKAPQESREEKPKKSKKEKKPSTFSLNVKEYLAAKEIEVLADLPSKAKEYNARIRIDTLLGKQEYLLLAKEKKKLTEDDLAIALHRTQTEKMPALILSAGEPDKEASAYLAQWKNLLKIEKINL